MNLRRSIPFLCLFAFGLTGCPDNPTTTAPTRAFVSLTEPAADEELEPLESGEVIETELESREAILAVFKGIPSPPTNQPLEFEFVRSIDRPVFLDRDGVDGPRQWITVAELQDGDGNVLWFDRVNSIFQLLEFLQLVLAQQSSLSIQISQVLNFVSTQYPQLLEFAVRIPVGIEGATDYVLKVPGVDGELYEAVRIDVSGIVDAAAEPQIDGETSTIVESGSPEDSLDIVILGDGYTAEQREKFDLDAKAIAERLLKAEPFATHAQSINVHTVWTPSVEQGAGYDCTGILTLDAGCKDGLRDTPFETAFVISALADRLNLDLQDTSDRVAMPLQVARLYDAASHAPFDEIIMISNTRRTSGFAGLYVSILTAYDPRLSFPDTAVHEFGHSFGVLGDEYNQEGDPCLFNEPRIPLPQNISATADPDEIKWSAWIEDGTPLPTPGSERDDYPVGAYQGAYNCDELHRPSYRCKMKNSDDEFCPVCAEQLVQRIHTVVDPAAQAPFTAEGLGEGALSFSAPMRQDAPYTAQWTLGDTVVGEGATLELTADALPDEWTELRVEVRESSAFTRADSPRLVSTQRWWVKK